MENGPAVALGIGMALSSQTGAIWHNARQNAKTSRRPSGEEPDERQQLGQMIIEAIDRAHDEARDGRYESNHPSEPTDPEFRAFGRRIQADMDRIYQQVNQDRLSQSKLDKRSAFERRMRSKASRSDKYTETDVQFSLDLWDLAHKDFSEEDEWQRDDDAVAIWAYYRCRKFDEAKAMGLPYPTWYASMPVRKDTRNHAPTVNSPPRKKQTKPSKFQIYRHGKLSYEKWNYPEGYTGPRPPVEVDQKPCFREEVVIPPQPEVRDAIDNDIDNATFVDPIEWEARLQRGARRQAERQQKLESERQSRTATAEVPSIIGTVVDTAKSWISRAWTTVKTALWG